MKKYSYIFLLFFTCIALSQKHKTNTSFQTELFIGQHIEHDTSLKNAIQNNSYGFLLSYNYVQKENSKFNKLFNFPKRGYSFLYHQLNSDVLGELYAGFRHFTYNLTPSKKNPIELTTAFGIGYVTKKYHKTSNPKNTAIGSNIVASAYLKLQYLQYLKNTNFSLNSSVSLIHYSNIAYKNPNLGLNTLTFNVGVNYHLENTPTPKEKITEVVDSSINYNLIFRTGFNESKEIDSGLYPFYTVGFYGSKAINNYSTLTAGTEFFSSNFLKYYSEFEKDNSNIHRGGIFIGHELTQHKFSFISQLGFYVYYPKEYVSRIYERFGFKYTLGKHLFSEVSLKANLFRAESLELGIGYKF